jgi:hypothetical protein
MAFGITTAAATRPATESAPSQRRSNGNRHALTDVEFPALFVVKTLRGLFCASNCVNLIHRRTAKNNDEAALGREQRMETLLDTSEIASSGSKSPVMAWSDFDGLLPR